MTIIFSITFILLGDAGTNKFSTFTSENWINYPMQRILMYPDLKKHYNIVGYSTNDIKTLLGEPEYIDSSYTYLYESGRYLIFIEFNNGKVVDMYYRN